MIWPRMLLPYEVKDIVFDCGCPIDYVVYLAVDRVELYGEAWYDYPFKCPRIKYHSHGHSRDGDDEECDDEEPPPPPPKPPKPPKPPRK